MKTAPRYPNLDNAIGSSVPVITALLASGSIALAIVPLATDLPTSKMRWAGMGMPQATIVLAMVAVILLVASTLMAVHAHASSIDLISADRRATLKQGVSENSWSNFEAHWRKRSRVFYEWSRTLWLAGTGFLFLSFGLLSSLLVNKLLVVSSVGSTAIFLALLASDWTNKIARTAQMIAGLVCAVIALSLGLVAVF